MTIIRQNLRPAFLCIFLFCAVITRAQFFDSLRASTGIEMRLSSKSYQPFWLISNRFGTVTDRRSDLTSFVRVANTHVIAEHEYANDKGYYDYDEFKLSYGLSMYNNNHFRSVIAEEGYVRLDYKNWSLRAGRFEETTGDIDPRLSTGSLGISGNALPIPKIGIAVTDYTNIPFTGGWLQFKGTFAHGWLGSNRFIKKTYYHEKTFFLRVGPRRFKLYGGIEHFAEWGGENNEQQMDKSMKSFLNVVFARSTGNSNAREGDQRGVLEGGAYWENNDVVLHGYLQQPFEGKQDIGLRNSNMLAGFTVSMKNKYLGLQKVLVEIISTKSVNTHIASSQRESYYNNNIYKTGWEYENNIIGTPLFLNRTRASKYFPEIQPFDWNSSGITIPGNANIINNRIFGIHTGVLYSITGLLEGKTLVTYTENYGSTGEGEAFAPSKKQIYSMQQFRYDIPKNNLTITAALGLDFGQMSKSIVAGGFLGIEWNITADKHDDPYWKN
jgi:hypothetical protein